MAVGINQYGIVFRHEEGITTLLRPGKNGGVATEVEVPTAMAEAFRLVTGDIVEGTTASVDGGWPETALSDEVMEDEAAWDEQIDEPIAARNIRIPNWLTTRPISTERLMTITRINGLTLEEAEERPFPRARRSHSERIPADRWLSLATSADDLTGRMLDFAAPLGIGTMGAILGQHGSGLTHTLRAVLRGITRNAPDCVAIVLLLRARGEEVTDWRRQFPEADIVVCPSSLGEATSEQTLRMADLVLEAAQRQTELGRDVVLLVDSLTGLWGTMLEVEAADAQAQADQSRARHRMREWVQKAGCFRGTMPLGGSLGGSLTLLGTVWQQSIDLEAEEEGEVHPHLRLLEHLVHETSWRVPLSDILARQRLYPALDVKQCLSRQEENVLPAELLDPLRLARASLPKGDPIATYKRLIDALEATIDLNGLLAHLARPE